MKLVSMRRLAIGILCTSVLVGQVVWADEAVPLVADTEKLAVEDNTNTAENLPAETDIKEELAESETEGVTPTEEVPVEESVEEESIGEVEAEEECVEEVIEEDAQATDQMKLDIQIDYQAPNGRVTALTIFPIGSKDSEGYVYYNRSTDLEPSIDTNIQLPAGSYILQLIAKDDRNEYCFYATTSNGILHYDLSNMVHRQYINKDTTYGTSINKILVCPSDGDLPRMDFILSDGQQKDSYSVYTNPMEEMDERVYLQNSSGYEISLKREVSGLTDGQMLLGSQLMPSSVGYLGKFSPNEDLRLKIRNETAMKDEYGNYLRGIKKGRDDIFVTATITGANGFCSTQSIEWDSKLNITAPMAAGDYKLTLSFPKELFIPLDDITATFTVGGGSTQPTTNAQVISFVKKLYEDCMGRAADEAGLNSWVSQLTNKSMDASSVVKFFVNSPEFQAKHLSHEDYIKVLYSICLNRAVDEAGLNYWVDLLKQGETRNNILARFTNTEEFIQVCERYQVDKGSLAEEASQRPAIEAFVSRFYEKCMGRPADTEGLNYWVNGLSSSEYTGAQMAENFVTSEEFSNKGQSNGDFINTMYEVFFDRAADQGGKDYWISQLESDKGRNGVMIGFIYSAEFKAICDSYGIRCQ